MKNFVFILFLLALFVPPVARAADGDPKSNAEAAKSAEGQSDDKKKKGDADTTGGRFTGDPIYIHMSPMVLPVINESGVEQLVTLLIDVQVKNFDAADNMHANMPKIMDALMRALYGGLGQGSLRKGKLVDVAKVKSRAIAAVGEVIGIENVNDVLVQAVSQRML